MEEAGTERIAAVGCPGRAGSRGFLGLLVLAGLITALAHAGCGQKQQQDAAVAAPPEGAPAAAAPSSPPSVIPPGVLDDVARHTNLGVAWMEQYSYKKAGEEFRQVVAKAPRWPDGLVNLALALYYDQVAEEALQTVDRALALEPGDPRAHYVRGLVFDLLGRSEESAAEFGRVAEADPTDAWASYNRGKALLGVDHLEEAVQALETARKLEPTNQSVHYNLYNAYRRLGRREDAKVAMQAFRDLKEREVGSLAGNQYGDQGRWALARAAVWEVVRAGFRTAETHPRWVVEGQEDSTWDFHHAGLGGSPPSLAALGQDADAAALAASYGPGVSVGDLDGDGRMDLVFPNAAPDGSPAPAAVLRGTARGGFEDATRASGLAAETGSAAAVLIGDLDDDGDSDLLVLGASGARLQRNDGTGTFSDGTRLLGQAATQRLLSGALGDADHDGDLDLLGCDPIGGAVHLFRNANDEGFSPAGPLPAPPPEPGGSPHPAAALFTDLDDDRDVDFLVADAAGALRFLRNDREERWSEGAGADGVAGIRRAVCVAAGDPNRDGAMDLFGGGEDGLAVFATNDGAGSLHPAAASREAVHAAAGGDTILAAQFADWDLDGSEDLVLFPSEGLPRLLRNRGDGVLDYRPGALGLAGDHGAGEGGIDTSGLRGGVAADLDGDGDLDFVLPRCGGSPVILRGEVEGAHWLVVDPTGTNSNRDGIGSKLSLHAGPLTQRVEVRGGGGSLGQAPAVAHFGLGPRTTVDALRLLWPGGVLQAEMDVSADQRLEVKELDRKGSSCPVLFAWDGRQWRFIADFLGVGGIGFLVEPPAKYGMPDPDERVLVEGGLAPLDGRWRVKILENLEEVTYLDAADLLVVDHPEGSEVYPRERFAAGGPLADGRIVEIDAGAKRRPIAARDEKGEDWLEAVLARDRRYVEGLEKLRYTGFAAPHGLELDFGDLPAGPDWTLFLYGWVDYEYSSSTAAAAQAGIRPEVCSLWMPDGVGGWRIAIDNMGFPAGLPRMMVHRLGDLPSRAGGRLLLRTNMLVYWDEVFLAEAREVPEARITRVAPDLATLRRVGYPRVYRPGGRDPEAYDYGLLDPWYPWKTLTGDYTRFGTVTPLLAAADDRFVILARGEEVEVAYDPTRAPAPRGGFTRTFVLDAHGYCKDMDPHGAFPDTVAPLPFRAMTAYPYGPRESYPADAEHRAYLEEWNTRRLWGR